MTRFIEALRYKPEGSGFDSRWCHHNPFRPHYGLGIDSASNRNEYQEYILVDKDGWSLGLTTLPLSCVDYLEIWEPQPPGILRACKGIALPLQY